MIEKLDKMEAAQVETRMRLDEHIRVDDERNADLHRAYILRFNMELRRGMQHTDEDFRTAHQGRKSRKGLPFLTT